MNILGIESTAHTLGIGIVDERSILSDKRMMYRPETGGIRPGDAAEHHAAWFSRLLTESLEMAKLDCQNIDGIAFSQGPGMHACLNIGAVMARYLSLRYGIPLYGVNHAIAHLEIGKRLCGVSDPDFLYVSGGNSQLITKKQGRYFVLGETQDIAIGNALDKLARTIGIPH